MWSISKRITNNDNDMRDDGFDVPFNAERLYLTFDNGRRDGTITPEKPIKGIDIAYRIMVGLRMDPTKEEITDVHVRKLIHHLRSVKKVPIGSTGEDDGYYLCIYLSEWNKTKAALLSRIKNQQAAAYGPDKFFEMKQQTELIPS